MSKPVSNYFVAVISGVLAVCVQPALAQQSAHALLDRIVPNGSVNAVVHDKTHHALYIGGSFRGFGRKTGGGAIFNGQGKLIPNYPAFNGHVYASIADGHGGFYVGGDFTQINGRGEKYLAHINQAGHVDDGFTPAVVAPIRNIAKVGPNLYAASTRRVYEVNLLSKKVNPAFSLQTNNTIYKMVADPFGVYIGGIFSEVNGEAIADFAKASRNTGVVDRGYYRAPGVVRDIVLAGNDELFLSTNVVKERVIKLREIEGVVNEAFNPGVLITPTSALAFDDQWLYAGLSVKPYVRRYDRVTGRQDRLFNLDVDSRPSTINVNNDYIYLSGGFKIIQRIFKNQNIARFSKGSQQYDRNYVPTVSQRIVTAALGNDGHVFYGGFFSSAEAIAARHIAKIDLNTGLLDPAFKADINGTVYALLLDGDRLFAGGQFSAIDGALAQNIGLVSANSGLIDAGFRPNASGPVFVLKKHRGTLFVGGRFIYMGGRKVNFLTRYKLSDLTADTQFDFGQDNVVWDVAFSGKYMFVGGAFAQHLKSYSLDTGVLLSKFKPQLDGTVRRLLFDVDHVYAVGSFSGVVVRLNPRTGVRRPKFMPNITGAGFSLAKQGDALYVGTTDGLVRLDGVTGERDQSFQPNANGLVYRLLLDDKRLFVVGYFTQIADQFEPYLSQIPLPVV